MKSKVARRIWLVRPCRRTRLRPAIRLWRLVNAFLSDAVKRVASDVHFEPEQSFLRVRYRIDGVLRQIRSLHRSYWQAMCVRLKVMSDMDIAEVRQPQDGKISMTLYGHKG